MEDVHLLHRRNATDAVVFHLLPPEAKSCNFETFDASCGAKALAMDSPRRKKIDYSSKRASFASGNFSNVFNPDYSFAPTVRPDQHESPSQPHILVAI